MSIFFDKLDKINREVSIHSHLVKWWDVNYIPVSVDEALDATMGNDELGMLESELTMAETSLLNAVLEQHDNTRAYEDAKNVYEEQERINRKKAEDEANEIFLRLMREAQEDEAKKQAEIDEAYAAQL